MEDLSVAQKAALELMLQVAQAQAELVQGVLARDTRLKTIGQEVGSLLGNAFDFGFEVIDTLGLKDLLNSAAPSSPRTAQPAPCETTPAPTVPPTEQEASEPAAEQQSTPESQINAILQMMAEGYSAGQPGDAVAQRIRAAYPAAISGIQQYLAMDDFLVLMWLRQQPALATVAADEDFPPFYAKLKIEFERTEGGG